MKILAINPGSTSTKISLCEDEEIVMVDDIFHDAPELLKYHHVNDQIPFRKKIIENSLSKHGYSLNEVDVFVGRGGSAMPCRSGVMHISRKLYDDTSAAVGGSEHPAKLGVMMAYEYGKEYGKEAYTLNPTNVDELIDIARITGINGIYRNAQAHVLNQKAVAMHHSQKFGTKYEERNYIVAHIDGGITVNAHRKGKMIDGNVGSGGDGPFTPTRIGSIPVLPLLDYIEEHGIDEVRRMCSRSGGFVSYFKTSDANKIHKLVEEKDKKAVLIWESMLYQISKEIGSMAVSLEGQVDAILLTGGLLRFDDISEYIRSKCNWIAPIYAYPGEMEQETMTSETLKALRGETEIIEYDGVPVWKGI